MQILKEGTHELGDIVLFHCCHFLFKTIDQTWEKNTYLNFTYMFEFKMYSLLTQQIV